MLPLDAVGEAVPREWSRFRSLLPAAEGPGWSAPTRLAGWTVRDLAAHAVWGVSMEADALRRRRTGGTGRAEGRAVGEEAEPEAILAAFDTARSELAAEVGELAREDLDSLVPLPYGDIPLAMFSQVLVMEAGIHTDDLAAAFGQSTGLSSEVIVTTELYLRVFLPVIAASAEERPAPGLAVALRGQAAELTFQCRDGGWEATEPGAPLSPAVTVEADDSALLLFALGRIPSTDPRLSFSGDPDLAARIKVWLPGP